MFFCTRLDAVARFCPESTEFSVVLSCWLLWMLSIWLTSWRISVLLTGCVGS